MASFAPIRGTRQQIENTPLVDGQFLIETDQGDQNKTYIDAFDSLNVLTRTMCGGSSTFAGLSDTDISSPQDNQIVQYATVSGNKVLQNVTMDALPTQNSAKPVTSGGAYTALSGKASTSALDEWTSGAQTLDGETFVFDNLDDTYGYDLFGDDKLYTITNFAKGTGTNTGTIKLTYTVSGASIGDYGYLRIFK